MPTGREVLWFTVPTTVVIVVAAHLSEPGGVGPLLALVAAGLAFVARSVATGLLEEVLSLVVIALVGAAVAPGGFLELGLAFVCMVSLDAGRVNDSTARAALVPGAALTMLTFLRFGLGSPLSWPSWSGAVVLLWLLGRNLAAQRRLIAELEATRLALADAAVADERRRMARELHDLAGHALAATLLHLTGARHVLRRDPDEAARALEDAERAGRDGMDRIRAAVVALRATERATDAPLVDTVDLDVLLEDYRRAGLEVTWRVEGDLGAVRGPAAVAVHRIVREAVTNAARHAPGNRVEVTVAVDGADRSDRGAGSTGGTVAIEVRDRGPAPAGRPGRGGFGLLGMEERARGLGGSFEAGPTVDGWRVEATIPAGVGGGEAG